MRNDLTPNERAENAAHEVAAHFFGETLGNSQVFADRCGDVGVTLTGANLLNCVFEPLFLARIVFRDNASKVFSVEAARTFVAVIDQVFPFLFASAFVSHEPSNPLAVPPKIVADYNEFARTRDRQYGLCRRSFGLRLYRLFKGADWFDGLFLINILRRDFRDTHFFVADELLDSFAANVVASVRAHATQIRDDGFPVTFTS